MGYFVDTLHVLLYQSHALSFRGANTWLSRGRPLDSGTIKHMHFENGAELAKSHTFARRGLHNLQSRDSIISAIVI